MTSQSPRRALVVIDVQNEYINGKFRIEYPPVDISLPNIERVMDAATKHNIPVVVVQHVLPHDAPIFAEGSDGAKLYPAVAERRHSYLVTKTLPSVFTKTGFGQWLEENDIDTLTVVGYMTHNCNDSTIREAMHRGYHVETLHDATGSLPYKNNAGSATAAEIHRVTLVVMESAYAAVMSTDDWLTGLERGGRFSSDNIYASNQRAIGHM
ncbi:nicotinamidase-related amidase [Paraburkholderia unamae]|uniref:cysteine hydrolase family protein n=1 Tax=Paraburkholderia unamae TaxID=219649 RepID=UPI000DC21841|nr:cysteine hydrolase family protein [Paraburkholderia unamae]RAR67922.1 nicotinamidase-related amidase [Paraburkholderia unamae]